MSWSEAVRLGRELELDPGTRIGAAVRGWHWPWTTATDALVNILEALADQRGLYPRPWDLTPAQIAAHNEQVLAVLAAAQRDDADRGHAQPLRMQH